MKYELSDLQGHAKFGTTLVLRILDIVKPMTVHPLYRHLVPVPEPGALLYRYDAKGKKVIVRVMIKGQRMGEDIRGSLLQALGIQTENDFTVSKREVYNANNAGKNVDIKVHTKNIQKRRHLASATSKNSKIAGRKSSLQPTRSSSIHTNTTKRP